MSTPKFLATGFLLLSIPLGLFAQSKAVNSGLTAGSESAAIQAMDTPKLAPFDPNLVDKSLDPCNDFYKYACTKWLTANPIPPDQVYWSTGSGLELWNENLLRETLEAASKNDSSRNAVRQKIGDYWAACMDESGIERAWVKPVQPELDRIAALKSKKEITLEIVHLHHSVPGSVGTIRQPNQCAIFRLYRPTGLRRRLEGCRANRPGRPEPAQPRLLPEK